MLSATCRTSSLLMIVTSAVVLDQVESMSWAIIPTMPSVRSFFWPNSLPSVDNVDEIARQHAIQTQSNMANNMAHTQNNIAQVQNTVNDHLQKMQDNINTQVSDISRSYDYNAGPGTKRTVSVSNDGMTEEMITNYESPDGTRRGFSKTSITTFGNPNNWN